MNGLPLPQVCEIEKLRRELIGGVHQSIPENCVAIRTSRTGEVTFLTEEEYNNLINNSMENKETAEVSKAKAVFRFEVDNDGFVTFEAKGDYKDGVGAELYELCCKAQIAAINWRSKNLKK